MLIYLDERSKFSLLLSVFRKFSDRVIVSRSVVHRRSLQEVWELQEDVTNECRNWWPSLVFVVKSTRRIVIRSRTPFEIKGGETCLWTSVVRGALTLWSYNWEWRRPWRRSFSDLLVAAAASVLLAPQTASPAPPNRLHRFSRCLSTPLCLDCC